MYMESQLHPAVPTRVGINKDRLKAASLLNQFFLLREYVGITRNKLNLYEIFCVKITQN